MIDAQQIMPVAVSIESILMKVAFVAFFGYHALNLNHVVLRITHVTEKMQFAFNITDVIIVLFVIHCQ